MDHTPVVSGTGSLSWDDLRIHRYKPPNFHGLIHISMYRIDIIKSGSGNLPCVVSSQGKCLIQCLLAGSKYTYHLS